MEFPDVYYGLDFLFLSDRLHYCGGSGLTKAFEKIPSYKEHELGDPEIEGKDSRVEKSHVSVSQIE